MARPLQVSVLAAAAIMLAACVSSTRRAAVPPVVTFDGALDGRFESDVLGFSIRYPSAWRKYGVETCGSGSFGKTDDELLALPRYPLGVRSEGGGYDVGFTVTAFRRFDQSPQERLDWLRQGDDPGRLTSFSTNDGTPAECLTRRSRVFYEGKLHDDTYVTYIVAVGARRLELDGRCPTGQVHELRPTFDAIARSLEIREPWVDRPTPGVWKSGRLPGLSFEYPGEWVWERAADNDYELTNRSAYIRPPRVRIARSRDDLVTIQIGRQPARGNDLDAWLSQMRAAVASTGNSAMQTLPRRTLQGLDGWLLEIHSAGFVPSVQCCYVFESPDGDWLTATGSCVESHYGELAGVFERIAKCVATE